MSAAIKLRRVYEAAQPNEGFRALVDRLWPRGIRKVDLAMDLWARDLAPSDELRRWFGHDPLRFAEFGARYRGELAKTLYDDHPLLVAARAGSVTLLYGAHDAEHNQAVVLRQVLLERLESSH